jgi:hypothetical protein
MQIVNVIEAGAALLGIVGHARGVVKFGVSSRTTIDGVVTGPYAGPTLTTSQEIMEFDFWLPVTAAGTLVIAAATPTAGQNYTINSATIRTEII